MRAVAEWLKRIVPSLVLDAVLFGALVFPAACFYLKWPMLCLYALLSVVLVMKVSASSWILRIVHDTATRISHGLEHATLAVCAEHDLSVVRGFTHGTDRFVIAVETGDEDATPVVREAAMAAIRRVLEGEHTLAYQPGCGTSEVVSAISLWLVYMVSVVFAIIVGGAAPTFVALTVLTFRIWLACNVGLGLLAQRLFTVSTAFTSARVEDVKSVAKVRGLTCPRSESWFEVVVHAVPVATNGGPVAPGVIA